MIAHSTGKTRVWRRLLVSASLAAVVAAVALTIVPSAFNSSTPNGLSTYVVATAKGPLPPCAGPDCTIANEVWYVIHVINSNRLVPGRPGPSRDVVPNAFVVTSIDQDVSINGVAQPGPFTYLAPPAWTFRSTMGRWPSTVTCTGSPGSYVDPCNVVHNPAVIPGENTVIFWAGWIHGADEPTGKHVFTYTIHGTLNGTPIDLTVRAPAITMT